MSWREICGFALLGLFISLSVSVSSILRATWMLNITSAVGFVSPGYGFSEMVLWNFLDDPEGLPHPSHGYWMPLVSILSAAGMVAFNRLDLWPDVFSTPAGCSSTCADDGAFLS